MEPFARTDPEPTSARVLREAIDALTRRSGMATAPNPPQQPKGPGARFRSSAATIEGLFAAVGRAALPREVVACALIPVVRLAWDRGGGAALESVRLRPSVGLRGVEIAVGADGAESALSALERWCAGEAIDPEDRRQYGFSATEVASSASWLYTDARNRWAKYRSINHRPLLDELFDAAERGDREAASSIRGFAAKDMAAAVDRATRCAWSITIPYEGQDAEAQTAMWVANWGEQAASASADVLYALGERQVERGPAAEPAYSYRTRRATEPKGGLRPAADAQVMALFRAGLTASK